MTHHKIERKEWERRFAARLVDKAALTPEEAQEVVGAELESWPSNEDDWLDLDPESAADENMSYWDDDGD